MAIVPGTSHRRVCRVLKVARASAEPTRVGPTSRRERSINALLAERLRDLIQRFPTFGYRRLWAWLRFREGWKINKKTFYRLLKIQRWFVHQRQATPRPRARGWRSQATTSNPRWAMDVTHIPCGSDGWAHLAAVIDCHDREVIGCDLALLSRPGAIPEPVCAHVVDSAGEGREVLGLVSRQRPIGDPKHSPPPHPSRSPSTARLHGGKVQGRPRQPCAQGTGSDTH